MSINDLESMARIDFVVTKKFSQVGEFAKMESANNEDQLSV